MSTVQSNGTFSPLNGTQLPTLGQAWQRVFDAIADAVKVHFDVLCEWQYRHVMRKRIANLDDHILNDIGMTREEAVAQASKPFWRP